ncbi:hypothetical protein EJB05_51944 [Eragrostis curvula]|uniref:Uncharacterized protein n=1 Tax=Eragrostis curvula TaxID=38414 RepID=A0A5J9SUC8_9POAL|nr:hypothetical protein EJB05_51944 [Eragrostis curvula]
MESGTRICDLNGFLRIHRKEQPRCQEAPHYSLSRSGALQMATKSAAGDRSRDKGRHGTFG